MTVPLRLLIVEDSEDDALLLVRQLERAGYSLSSVRVDNAADLEASLKKQDWDIIISDFVMPLFSGMQAMRICQKLAPDVPFIMLSGKTGEDIAVDAMLAGAHDYIMKDNLKRIVPALRRELKEAEDRRERKRAEEASSRNERQYRLLADNVSDVIWTSDLDMHLTYVSPSVARMIGYTSEELMKQTLDHAMTPESFRSVVKAQELRQAQSPERFSDVAKQHLMELDLTRKDGSTVCTETTWNFLAGQDGVPFGILGVSRDITERKNAERKLAQEHEERLHAYERLAYLGRLSGSIAHELRNPMATIGSSVHYLRLTLKDADEKTRKHLDRIDSAVRRSADVIQSLVDQARTKEPRLEMIDLVAITTEIVASCKVPSGVRVITEQPQGGMMVNADTGQLRMVFQNIVKNAVEAMGEKGTLRVSLSMDGRDAYVLFSDTGPGIPQANMNKVFLPLFTTKATGIGFGLSIAKAIIDLHGGLIEARSEPGKGATFIVKLPLCKPQ